MPRLIENSIVGEINKDKNNSADIKDIVRLFGAMEIDGKSYRIKTNVKRYTDNISKAYSYEITEIELLEVENGNEVTHSPNSSNNSITAANLLRGIEKSNSTGEKLLDVSKIVDEKGEPLVVYRGDRPNRFVFDNTQ